MFVTHRHFKEEETSTAHSATPTSEAPGELSDGTHETLTAAFALVLLVPTMGNFTPKRHLLNHPQTKPSQIRVEEKNGKRSCPHTRWNYLNFKAWKFQFGGGGWKRNPIFLWTDVFNLMAQSLRILLCALCSLFFVAAFLHLQANLALYKLLSQI